MKIILLAFIFFFSTLVYSQDGTLDSSFNTNDVSLSNGADFDVHKTILLPDGKILVCGGFEYFNGVYKRGIIRLNADGSFDSTFNSSGSGANGPIYNMALQTDGKIIIVGYFNLFNGISTKCIMRLNSDGSIDPTFNYSKGFNNIVHAVYIQPDGKILIGGTFSLHENTTRKYIARLNSDGNLDQSFDAGNTFMSTPICFGVQSDGKIITGGTNLRRLEVNGTVDSEFVSIGESAINTIHVYPNDGLLIGGNISSASSGYHLYKLHKNGAKDNSFRSGLPYQNGSSLAAIFTFLVQPDSKILITGSFATYFDSTSMGMARIFSDGTLDTSFSLDENTSVMRSVSSVILLPDGKYMIGGIFRKLGDNIRNRIARLQSDGKLDLDFSKATGADNTLIAFAKQDTGHSIIGGSFTDYNDVQVNRLARIDKKGALDGSFQIGSGFNNTVNTVAVQNDQKMVVGGTFTAFNNIQSSGIARLSQNGSYDNTFDIGSGANAAISSVAIQNDQKVLIAGSFTAFNNYPANKVLRLKSDGSVDTSFNVGSGANGIVSKVKIQADGKILLAGDFTVFNGAVANRIVRLNVDGSVDIGFSAGSGADQAILTVELQADGKILIGGSFRNFDGNIAGAVARLNSNGTFDNSLNIGSGFDGNVNALFIQNDGKIIVGGTFSNFRNLNAAKICRLNVGGTLDTEFIYGDGTNGTVNVISTDDNGSLMIGGQFTKYNGMVRKRIAKIFNQFNLSINNDSTVDDKIIIYPNPFAEKISIKSRDLISEISLISLEGKTLKVLKVADPSLELNLQDLNSGIYILKIQTVNSMKSYKVIKK